MATGARARNRPSAPREQQFVKRVGVTLRWVILSGAKVDYVAIALFVVLFATAEQFVGGHIFPALSTHQEVQLALAASFLFGIISAWRKDG